jgi:chemotaxis protein MotA
MGLAVVSFLRRGLQTPTIGIIGTVIGLVQVLQRLEDPTVLGPLVAGAFVATLWGALSANFFWLPMAANPRALRAKLRTLRLPSETRLSGV